MKQYSIYLLILLLYSSCSNSIDVYNSKIQIAQKEFFKTISYDTINLFSLNYKNAYAFEKPFFNTKKPINRNGKTNWVSKVQLISEHLNVKDTAFVSNQLKSEDLTSNYLKSEGFKTINYDSLVKRTYIQDSIVEKKLVSQDSLDKVFSLLKKHKYISILRPVFNKSLDLVYIEVDYEETDGRSLLYKKTEDTWVFHSEVGSWMR